MGGWGRLGLGLGAAAAGWGGCWGLGLGLGLGQQAVCGQPAPPTCRQGGRGLAARPPTRPLADRCRRRHRRACRAHRIGQTRTVHVTRITIPGTVEDRILELQERKRQLVADVLGGGAGDRQGSANRLSMQELQYLFYGGG